MPPSGQECPSRPESEPTFFVDRALGRYNIPNAIRGLGYEVVPMFEVYPDGTDQWISDPTWMRRADREGWVALTKDKSLIFDHQEVLAKSNLRLFAYNNANLTGKQMVARLERNFADMLARIKEPGPYAYVIGSERLTRRWP